MTGAVGKAGIQPLREEANRPGWGQIGAVLLATFAITVGYGVTLPILPFLIEQISESPVQESLSWYTGLLTAAYVLAIFVGAPLWGRVSDGSGRKPILLLGLSGYAAASLLFASADRLWLLFVARFAAGFFASAIIPVAYAYVGDHAPTKEWRARRFALINLSGTAGFFIGPLLGGLSVVMVRSFWSISPESGLTTPLFVSVMLAFLAAIVVASQLKGSSHLPLRQQPIEAESTSRGLMWRLRAIAFVTAFAVGAFEVSLSLQGKVLGLDAGGIGAMFAECSLVMAIVQILVFSPIIRPDTTRWLILPGLLVLSVGLIAVPLAATSLSMSVTVALVAASAGIVSPIVTYWASMNGTANEGANLGRMTAAASLGQAVGSASGGLLFGLPGIPGLGYMLAAFLVGGAFLGNVKLPYSLRSERRNIPADEPHHSA